ncbi:MAG: GAF domain-containing protein, partial [Spirochaetia bacterium]|nr:GAF domain-containing protein [Spirochaetia bacterium]
SRTEGQTNTFFTDSSGTETNKHTGSNSTTGQMDLTSVLKSSQAFTSEFKLESLLRKVMKIVIESAGAQRGFLILLENDELFIEAEGSIDDPDIPVLQKLPVNSFDKISSPIVNFVSRTKEDIVISDVQNDEHPFFNDHYLKNNSTRSLLCIPVIHQNKLTGILYLENNLTAGAFTEERLKVLKMLSSQAAISIENARLYMNMEDKIKERTRDLQLERDKSNQLLLNILPKSIADELKANGRVNPMFYESVSIMFTDFVSFTQKAESLSPTDLVENLNNIFFEFDNIADSLNLEKLKIIGDAYMCAGGLPEINFSHPVDICLGALRIQKFISEYQNGIWDLRIGIHTGPAMAGVIGKSKFAFDVWGDTVNVASRMESGGTPGKINISEATNQLVNLYFETEFRGKQHVKNKGELEMYYLLRLKPEYSSDSSGIYPNEKLYIKTEIPQT